MLRVVEIGCSHMTWYGQSLRPTGMPDDLITVDEVVQRLAEYGIKTTERTFGYVTLINEGPASWVVHGAKHWSRSQLDAWVLGWKDRPKEIGLRFKEPTRLPGFDRELAAPKLHWVGEGIEYLVPVPRAD